MNELITRQNRSTQAAEGVPRWRWTTAELLKLKELGAFSDSDRFELIGGEIVPMSPTGRAHEVLAEELQKHWVRLGLPDIWIAKECQLNLDGDSYTVPDLVVRPDHIKTYDLKGDTALLIVEVADSSIDYDHHTKAKLYARYGVREYWVINARSLMTTVHRLPTGDTYSSISSFNAEQMLEPQLAPGLAVRLADLDLT